MLAVYSGYYIDRAGCESIEIQNDGSELRTMIRGLVFRGASFDDWSLAPDEKAKPVSKRTQAGHGLSFNGDQLCDCRILVRFPLELLSAAQKIRHAWLGMDLRLGAPAPHGGIAEERLLMAVYLRDVNAGAESDFIFDLNADSGFRTGTRDPVAFSEADGLFEEALVRIQMQLAPAYRLRCCFGCGLSDYFPGGQGLFGELACFRNIPETYARSGGDKHGLLKIFDQRAGFVQETWLCPEFRPRKPGEGYRG